MPQKRQVALRSKASVFALLRLNHSIPVRAGFLIQICLVIIWWPFPVDVSAIQSEFGPNVKSFLEFIQHEETELKFQISHAEISRREYARSRSRFAIMREAVLERVRETGQDIVPELHVVTAQEIDQLMEDGMRVLKGISVGAIIEDKWQYLGKVACGEVFYIFERLSKKWGLWFSP